MVFFVAPASKGNFHIYRISQTCVKVRQTVIFVAYFQNWRYSRIGKCSVSVGVSVVFAWYCYREHTRAQNFVAENDLGYKAIGSEHFLGNKQIVTLYFLGNKENEIVAEKVLGNDLLGAEEVLGNKILCPSMSSDTII